LSAQYTGKFKQRHIYFARPDARYLGRPAAHNLQRFRWPGRPRASDSRRVAALRVPSRLNLRKEKSTWSGGMRGTQGYPAHTTRRVLGVLVKILVGRVQISFRKNSSKRVRRRLCIRPLRCTQVERFVLRCLRAADRGPRLRNRPPSNRCKNFATMDGRVPGTCADTTHTSCRVLGTLCARARPFHPRAVPFWCCFRQMRAKGNLESPNTIPRRASRKRTPVDTS